MLNHKEREGIKKFLFGGRLFNELSNHFQNEVV